MRATIQLHIKAHVYRMMAGSQASLAMYWTEFGQGSAGVYDLPNRYKVQALEALEQCEDQRLGDNITFDDCPLEIEYDPMMPDADWLAPKKPFDYVIVWAQIPFSHWPPIEKLTPAQSNRIKKAIKQHEEVEYENQD